MSAWVSLILDLHSSILSTFTYKRCYLAILRNAKDNLEDLDQCEIRTMLLRLPTMDMQRVRT